MAKLPVFTTERLILREVAEADASAYEKNFVDYEIISQLASVVPWPYPAGGVLDFIQHQIVPRQGNDRWVWGILLEEQPSEPAKFVSASYTEREIWELTKDQWREFRFPQRSR